MAQLFSVSELLELAVREEQTGAAYYRAMAQRADSEELQQFMREVAEMEDVHERKFRDMLKEAGSYEPTAESYGGEYEAYLSYMVRGRIFPPAEEAAEMADRQESEQEAVQTAMELERETLLLYHELIDLVPEQQRETLKAIVDEERQHVTDFARYKEEHFG